MYMKHGVIIIMVNLFCTQGSIFLADSVSYSLPAESPPRSWSGGPKNPCLSLPMINDSAWIVSASNLYDVQQVISLEKFKVRFVYNEHDNNAPAYSLFDRR